MASTKTDTPRSDLSAIEWRLALVAVLAIAYVIAWFGLETPPAPPPASLGAPAGSPPAAPVWIGELPPPARPRFVLPAGWTVAPRSEAAGPRPVARAPGAAPRRIRTRSS